MAKQLAADGHAVDADSARQRIVADLDRRIGQIDAVVAEDTKRGRTKAVLAYQCQHHAPFACAPDGVVLEEFADEGDDEIA
ncbi:MAG TPA: hypothetical protein VGJ20_08810 [Xanthobacteraceae bacterium]|jgi:hypothetical protein